MCQNCNSREFLDNLVKTKGAEIKALFSKYGIKAPVNIETLTDALILKGKDGFMNDLYAIDISNKRVEPSYKTSFVDKINNAINVIKGIGNVVQTALPSTSTNTLGTPTPTVVPKEETPVMLYVGVAFLIGLVGYYFYTKN